MNGYFCQGFNPLLAFPNRAKITEALSKLKFLVTMDPLDTETSRFWENHGELQRRRNRPQIQTEVIQLPTTCFAEEEGSLTNSGRWLQWHWAGGTPPGEAKHRHLDHGADLSAAEGALREGGRRVPRPDPQSPLALRRTPTSRRRRNSPRRSTATRSADVPDPTDADQDAAQKRQAARQLRRAARRRHDGVRLLDLLRLLHRERQQHGPPGQLAIPTTPAPISNWAFAWPANRRILYNRASADVTASHGIRSRKLIEWDGEKWTGYDVPGHRADRQARTRSVPFIMNQEGVSRLFARGHDARRAVPRRTTSRSKARSPTRSTPAIRGNPVARVFKDDFAAVRRRSAEFPYAATSYRLTEHFHYWTKHNRVNAVAAAGILRRDLGAARDGEGHRQAAAGCGCGRSAARSSPRRW